MLALLTLGVFAIGVLLAWAMTVPLHSLKEMRPMTPRDVASETPTDGSVPPPIRASYRTARCPHCHHRCTLRDVTPVVSWFRGCPECSTPLPATVVLLQLGLPTVMAVTAWTLGANWATVPYLFFAVALAAIALVDLRIWLIPYWMPWLGAAIGVVLIAAASALIGAPGAVLTAVIGAVVTFALFFVLFVVSPGKLGFSDVRLALLLGLFLAWLDPMLPVFGLLFGALIGLAMGLVALARSGDSRFPFGPGLCLGAMAAIWLYEPLLSSAG